MFFTIKHFIVDANLVRELHLTLVCLLGCDSLQTPCVGIEEEEQKLTYREKTRKYCSAASYF